MIRKGDHVCFVTPPANGKYIIRDYAGGLGFEATYEKDFSYILPPLDFLQLASCISDQFEVSLVDAQAKDLSLEKLIGKITNVKANLAIVELALPTLSSDIQCARSIKEKGIPVIGKIHTQEKEILKTVLSSGVFELCIVAEVEDNLIDILLGNDQSGTAFLENNEVIIKEKDFVFPLDNLPFPARELVGLKDYYYPKLGHTTTILASRGCPYSCRYYCPYPLVQGKKWRPKTSAYVLAEIQRAISMGHRKILFRDPIFSLDQNRAMDISRGISAFPQDISWWCETRADRLTENLIQKMALSGCKGINVGVESGDPKLRFSKLKQGVSDEILINVSNWCRKVNIHLAFLLMVGFPGENRKSIVFTADLLRKCRPGSIGISFPVCYPGTQMHKEAVENHWDIERNHEMSDGQMPVFQSYGLKKHEMIEAKKMLLALFDAIQAMAPEKEEEIFIQIVNWSNSKTEKS